MATNTAYTNVQSQDDDAPHAAQGYTTFPATSIVAADSVTMTTGFKPRYVRWCNVTSRIQVEWYEGMAANTCIKTVAAGTRTLETTNGGITIGDKDFSVLQNATLLAIAASEICAWRAEG